MARLKTTHEKDVILRRLFLHFHLFCMYDISFHSVVCIVLVRISLHMSFLHMPSFHVLDMSFFRILPDMLSFRIEACIVLVRISLCMSSFRILACKLSFLSLHIPSFHVLGMSSFRSMAQLVSKLHSIPNH